VERGLRHAAATAMLVAVMAAVACVTPSAHASGLVFEGAHKQKWPRYAGDYAFEGSDGGYWALGTACSRDIRDEQRKATRPLEALNLAGQVQYQCLLRMDSTGTAVNQRQLFHPSEHNITCGIDVGSGL